MNPRLTRLEHNQRNRRLVLDAARRVFLARGYHAASLDQIADEAGFSKGVVYSQFDSKADMFLALLEERIDERAAENASMVEGLSRADGIAALTANAARRERAESDWWLLLIEFRVHAARDSELNRRYAALHARTLDGIARLIERLYERAGEPPPLPSRDLAQLVLTVSVGARLEHAADPGGTAQTIAFEFLVRLTEPPTISHDDGAHLTRRLA